MTDHQESRRAELRIFLQEEGGFARVVEKFSLTASQASYLSQLTAQDSAASFGERSAKNWEDRLKMRQGRLVEAGRVGFQSTIETVHAGSDATPSAITTLTQALEVVAASLNELPDERRELAAQHLQTLARAPDSKKAMEALLLTLVSPDLSAAPTAQQLLSARATVESSSLRRPAIKK